MVYLSETSPLRGLDSLPVVILSVLTFVAVFTIAVFVNRTKENRAKERSLREAPTGARRIESVKAHRVNSTVQMYSEAGWQIVDRVTITFQKA